MKKRIKKTRLRRKAKKVMIALAFIVADIITYHYLGIIGAYVGETAWANTFCCVGWFWLLAGQFMALHMIWED